MNSQLEHAAKRICELFPNTGILGIDGCTGVGKTTVGRLIATIRVPVWPLDIDAFIAPKDGKLKEALQLHSLKLAIENATVPVVVSGVCLLEVLCLIGVRLDAHVYLKRLNAGYWADEGEALSNDLQTYEAAGLEPSLLRNKIRDYHLEYRPHEVADLVLEMTH